MGKNDEGSKRLRSFGGIAADIPAKVDEQMGGYSTSRGNGGQLKEERLSEENSTEGVFLPLLSQETTSKILPFKTFPGYNTTSSLSSGNEAVRGRTNAAQQYSAALHPDNQDFTQRAESGGHGQLSSEANAQPSFNETRCLGKLGTFSGVFVPTILNVLSVLMFLRFGFVLGQTGVMAMTGKKMRCC